MNKTQHMLVNDVRSSTAKVIHRVPHRSVLGPYVLLIYMKNIIRVIINIFADESKLLKAIHSMGELINLHSDLITFIRWVQKYNIQLKENKFELIHFGKEASLHSHIHFLQVNTIRHQTLIESWV